MRTTDAPAEITVDPATVRIEMRLSRSTAALRARLATETGLTVDEAVTHAVRRWASVRLPPPPTEQFAAIMAKVPNVPPVPGDEL